jgi:tripartite-type tricarboxylate transporter receptor subunit TctC
MIEAGLPAMTVITHYGLLAPSGTSPRIVSKLNLVINEVLRSADLTATMTRIGFDPAGGSAQDFAASIAADLQKWEPIVRLTGFQIE